MKVKELLMNIHNKDFKLERGLQVKKYLPIEVKKTIAQGIIYDCTSEEDGVVNVDSVERYLSYVKYMITMHTNLEYTDEDYDVLCSTEYENGRMLDAIMSLFDTDAKECNKILDFMMDDYMRENSAEHAVVQFVNSLNVSLNQIVSKLNEKIGDIDVDSMIPSDVDKEQLKKFLNDYIK